MRLHVALLLALSCSRDAPPPPAAPWSGSDKPPGICTRVLDDRTTVQISDQPAPSFEPSAEVKAVRAKSGLSDGSAETPPTPSTRSRCEALAHAPVVIITNDELRVGETHVASLAEATASEDVIEALVRALPAGGGIAILQADDSTSVVVVNRVVIACKRAGYRDVVFAVAGNAAESRAIRL